jgi:putative component of toxin-antitoxin plasmid stabilization module
MIELRQTEVYARWFGRLKDPAARARVLVRVRRLSLGNPGDVRAINKNKLLIVLLAGGDKRTQHEDIHTKTSKVRCSWLEGYRGE